MSHEHDLPNRASGGPVSRQGGGRPAPLGRATLALALLPLAAACDGLLEVELPTRVGPEELEDPGQAQVIQNSLIADFECAYVNHVIGTGMVAGELRHSSTRRAAFLWSQRRVTAEEPESEICTGGTSVGIFRPLQTARFQAEDFLERLEEWGPEEVPDHDKHVATASAYAGYSLAILGEGYCEATVDESPVKQPSEVLELAEAHFDRALAVAGESGYDDVENLAHVGRARVRLNLGRDEGALADARAVSEGFEYHATYSSADPYRRNKLYDMNVRNGYVSVSEDYVGLEWEGEPDPRVSPDLSDHAGHDGSDLYHQARYTSPGDPVRLASWDEARLIEAEIEGGETAVDILAAFHQEAGLPSYEGGTEEEVQEHVLLTRERELFLEGHRLNDMLRHGLQFNEGTHHDGVSYGETTCLPLPQQERDGNPNI